MQEFLSNEGDVFRTEPDSFGVFREYSKGKPSITPDKFYSLSDLAASPYLALDPSSPLYQSSSTCPIVTEENPFAPFKNATTSLLMTWSYRPSNTKSIPEMNSLVNDVILAPEFNAKDLVGFDAAKEMRKLYTYRSPGESLAPTHFSFNDKWTKSTVEIPVPCDGFCFPSEAEAPKFKVDVHHRKLTDVIKAAYSEPAAQRFHTFPFRAYWKPSETEPEERIYSESFTGDAWNNEYEKILESPQEDYLSEYERFLVSLMIWSDSTSLAQFGTAELWPMYLFIGAQSKYTRVQPSSFAAHHIAYFPKASSNSAKLKILPLL
jgi:hypothetical protein